MKQPRNAIEGGLAGALVVSAFIAYCATLAPSLYWADSAELQRAASTLELPHPSGYPLYVLVNHLWVLVLPFGSTAWKVNLFSALVAALSVGVVFRIVVVLTGRISAAFLASVLLATSPAYWSQAVVAEVYAFHALLMSLLVLALADESARWNQRWFTVPLLLGMTLFHHRMSILLAPGLLYLLVRARNELRPTRANLVELCVAGVLSLAPLVFMYSHYEWTSFGRFVGYFLHGESFFSLERPLEHFRSEVLPLLLQQLGIVGLAVMACGAFRVRGLPDWRADLGRVLALSWCVGAAFLVILRVVDLYAFASHVQLLGALLFGLGIARILSYVEDAVPAHWTRIAATALCLALSVSLVVQGLHSYDANDLSADLAADARTRIVLEDVQENAIILAGWAMGQALLAQQALNGLRPDVTIGVGGEHRRGDLGPHLRTGRPLYLWGTWWGAMARRQAIGLEAVNPEVHGAPLYPGDSFASFDRGFRALLAGNRDLRRVRGARLDRPRRRRIH